MARLTSLDIYKHLDKSNCGECGLPSCMAFAAAVSSGNEALDKCPRLNRSTQAQLATLIGKRTPGEDFLAPIDALKNDVSRLDLGSLADRLGAKMAEGKLAVRCLGREFLIDGEGNIQSDCHIHIWIQTILLNYLMGRAEGGLSGKWVSFGQLRGAMNTAPYFARRVEEPLGAIAEKHTEIFLDLLGVFGGEPRKGFQSDHAFVIYPLPRVPMLMLLWMPDEDNAARLKVLLDSTARDYLDLEVITFMGRGLVEMFQKIISTHQECSSQLLSL